MENYVEGNYVEGKNAVMEALKADRHIDKILISQVNDGSMGSSSVNKIIDIAKIKGIIVQNVPKSKLDDLSETKNHQGVGAFISCIKYSEISDMLDYAKSKNEDPFIIILDHLNDPHNLGAIIRTVEASGAHGVIIPNRRSAVVTSTVEKAAAGAVSHIKIAKVSNLVQAIQQLKKHGIWVYCADSNAKSMYTQDLKGPIAVVIGSEGEGISPLVQKNCDVSISIPMFGKVSSLNASVSAALVMYEVVRQRKFKS